MNTLTSPALAKYYDALHSITHDPLFDAQRWQNILRLNRGDYDTLLDSYSRFTGTEFAPRFKVVNPGDSPYVYAYVWNHETGSLVLLDDASQPGDTYAFGWDITTTGTEFAGECVQEISPLGSITDVGLLNIGVIFAPDADMHDLEKYENRFWWLLEGENVIDLVLPPLQYHSPTGAEGFWLEVHHDPAMRFTGW